MGRNGGTPRGVHGGAASKLAALKKPGTSAKRRTPGGTLARRASWIVASLNAKQCVQGCLAQRNLTTVDHWITSFTNRIPQPSPPGSNCHLRRSQAPGPASGRRDFHSPRRPPGNMPPDPKRTRRRQQHAAVVSFWGNYCMRHRRVNKIREGAHGKKFSRSLGKTEVGDQGGHLAGWTPSGRGMTPTLL
jgi:hypothetical protein